MFFKLSVSFIKWKYFLLHYFQSSLKNDIYSFVLESFWENVHNIIFKYQSKVEENGSILNIFTKDEMVVWHEFGKKTTT